MKTMLLNALKIAGLSAVFALPVINSNLFAEDTAVTQQAAHKGKGKHAGHKKGGMKGHKNQGRHATQATENNADEAQEAAHLFRNTVKLTAADDVSPENIMEHLNALKTTTGLTLRQGLYEIAMTTKGEAYPAEAKELFHSLLVQAANEAEIGFDQMNEVLGVLRTNEALVTNEQVHAIARDLNDAPEEGGHGKSRKSAVPMRKGAKHAAQPVTHREVARQTAPAAHEESEPKGNKKDQRKAAKQAAKTEKQVNKNAKKQAKAAKKAEKQQAKSAKQAARAEKQAARKQAKAARNESKVEQSEAADVNEAAVMTSLNPLKTEQSEAAIATPEVEATDSKE